MPNFVSMVTGKRGFWRVYRKFAGRISIHHPLWATHFCALREVRTQI
jgi:hypothetical protein